jgi:hypothetical protein
MAAMKTTVEIADALLDEAKAYAADRGLTLRQLIEEGLRSTLQRKPRTRFRLRDGSFGGKGLKEGAFTWPEIRQRAYEGRGE